MSIRLRFQTFHERNYRTIAVLYSDGSIASDTYYVPLTLALTDDFQNRRSAEEYLKDVVYPAERNEYKPNDPTQPDWLGNGSEIWIKEGMVKIEHQWLPEYREVEGGTATKITLEQFKKALEGLCIFDDMYKEASGDPEKLKHLTYTIELGE